MEAWQNKEMDTAGFYCLQKVTAESSWDFGCAVPISYDALGRHLAAIKDAYPENTITVVDRAHDAECMPLEHRGARKEEVRYICFLAADIATIEWDEKALFEQKEAGKEIKVMVPEASGRRRCRRVSCRFRISRSWSGALQIRRALRQGVSCFWTWLSTWGHRQRTSAYASGQDLWRTRIRSR